MEIDACIAYAEQARSTRNALVRDVFHKGMKDEVQHRQYFVSFAKALVDANVYPFKDVLSMANTWVHPDGGQKYGSTRTAQTDGRAMPTGGNICAPTSRTSLDWQATGHTRNLCTSRNSAACSHSFGKQSASKWRHLTTSSERISRAYGPVMSTGFDLQSVVELRNKPSLCTSRSLFRPCELPYCDAQQDPIQSLAGVFSTKEAFVKAVGAFGDVLPFTFTHLELMHDPCGRPWFVLHGELGMWSERQCLAIDTSISHSVDLAGAVVALLARRHLA